MSTRIAQRDAAWRLLADSRAGSAQYWSCVFYEDLPDDEIATVLGCSPGTVRSHASRGLATLRANLPTVEKDY